MRIFVIAAWKVFKVLKGEMIQLSFMMYDATAIFKTENEENLKYNLGYHGDINKI